MRYWATLDRELSPDMGRLNFALMVVSLIGCEHLGFLTSGGARHKKTESELRVDPGGYIIDFICEYFPRKDPFKKIAKILADALRHELIHGFGGRESTAPFELGLYVSPDTERTYEVRDGRRRPTLAVNAVAFADAVLKAFDNLTRRVQLEPDLVDRVLAGSRLKFDTPTAVVAEWHARVLPKVRKSPSNSACTRRRR
jgi:hypothetical protein